MSFMDSSFVPEDAETREVRQRKLIRASFFSDRLTSQDMVIRNISARGIGAVTKGKAPLLGEKITVSLPVNYQAVGVVSWVKGDSFGMALDQEINLQVLTDFIASQNEKATVTTDWEVKRLHRVVTPHVDPSKLRIV